MNDNMPSNSKTAKEEKEIQAPALKPVAKATLKKKSTAKIIAESLFDTGEVEEAKLDVTGSIIIPTVKNMALDIVASIMGTVTDAFEMALFGSTSARRDRRARGYTSYGAQYRDRDRDSDRRVTIVRGSEDRDLRRREISQRARSVHDFSEIVFEEGITTKENMDKAKEVLETLCDMLEVDKYSYVTVADLYDVCDITSTHQDRHWGWSNLAGARPEAISGGRVILRLPKPVYID